MKVEVNTHNSLKCKVSVKSPAQNLHRNQCIFYAGLLTVTLHELNNSVIYGSNPDQQRLLSFVIVTAVFLHVYMNKFLPGGRLTIRVRKVYNVMVKRKLRRK